MSSEGRVRHLAQRIGLVELAKARRDAADFAEAAEENRLLEAGLEAEVARLERLVLQVARQRSGPQA